MREQSPDQKNHSTCSKGESGFPIHKLLSLIKGFLFFRICVFFYKNCHIKLRHISNSQPAGNQEQDLDHFPRHSSAEFHDTLMKQRFADIAAEERNSRDSKCSCQKDSLEKRLVSSKPADFV